MNTFRTRTEAALRRDNRLLTEREPRTRAPLTDAELDAVYRAFLQMHGLDLCHALVAEPDELPYLRGLLNDDLKEARDAK